MCSFGSSGFLPIHAKDDGCDNELKLLRDYSGKGYFRFGRARYYNQKSIIVCRGYWTALKILQRL
jgi:hypothetical protein